jgi:hypothetical protein
MIAKRLTRLLVIALVALSTQAQAATITVSPFKISPSYVTGKDIYGAPAGPRQGLKTFGWKGDPSHTIRPLSVQADSALNQDLPGAAPLGLGMPPLFGGFLAQINGAPAPCKFTVRVQIQDGRETRPDYLNYLLYLENPAPMPPGIAYRLIGAMVFPAGDNGTETLVDLPSLVALDYASTGRSPAKSQRRAVVHDAESGRFYVSEATTSDIQGTLVIRGTKWAVLSPESLVPVGDFSQPNFKWVDCVGIYFDSGMVTTEAETKSFGQLCGNTLQSLSYQVALP